MPRFITRQDLTSSFVVVPIHTLPWLGTTERIALISSAEV